MKLKTFDDRFIAIEKNRSQITQKEFIYDIYVCSTLNKAMRFSVIISLYEN